MHQVGPCCQARSSRWFCEYRCTPWEYASIVDFTEGADVLRGVVERGANKYGAVRGDATQIPLYRIPVWGIVCLCAVATGGPRLAFDAADELLVGARQPVVGSGGANMRYTKAQQVRWLRLVAVVLAAVGVLAVGCGLTSVKSSSHAVAHPPHALLSTLGGEFTVDVTQPHVDTGSRHACLEKLGTAVLPRSATVSTALCAVVAVVAIGCLLTPLGVVAGRGPPRPLAAALTGQEVLTRFCLFRR